MHACLNRQLASVVMLLICRGKAQSAANNGPVKESSQILQAKFACGEQPNNKCLGL